MKWVRVGREGRKEEEEEEDDERREQMVDRGLGVLFLPCRITDLPRFNYNGEQDEYGISQRTSPHFTLPSRLLSPSFSPVPFFTVFFLVRTLVILPLLSF